MKFLQTLFLLFIPLTGFSQDFSLQQDIEALKEVEKITELIYNNQHDKVESELSALRQKVPANHPVYPMLKALNLYWKDAPMHTGSPNFGDFQAYLRETVQKSDNYLKQEQDETLVNFLALSAHSLLTRFHADKGDYMSAIGEAKNAYSFMKKGFDLTEAYSEFYFPVGLYNYYREKYPELNPVYKPFMFFFRSGDISKGLLQLEKAAKVNVFTKPEAGVFLTHIYLYYENNPAAALKNIRQLHEEFPQNRLFRLQLAEALLANGQYNQAAPHINFLLRQEDPFYKMAGQLFRGIYREKKEQKAESAKASYDQALQTAKNLSYMANMYRSMAYAGLGRYYAGQQEPAKAKENYKKALDLSYYEFPVKPEAKAYLSR